MAGAPLFDRQAHPFLLSEPGEAMFEHAQQMVSLAKRIEARFSPISASAGIVRLGLPESVAKACLSELFLKVRKLAPRLQLDVTVESSSSINRRLRNLSLDIGILAEADLGPPIKLEPIGRNPLSWLSSPALARRVEACTPAHSADLPILTTPEPSQTHAVVMEWFMGAGPGPRRLSTCNSLSMISRLISDGVGIGVLPIVMVQEELAKKVLVQLTSRPQLKTRTLQAAYHTEGVGAPGRVIEAVVDVVRKTLSLRVPLCPPADAARRGGAWPLGVRDRQEPMQSCPAGTRRLCRLRLPPRRTSQYHDSSSGRSRRPCASQPVRDRSRRDRGVRAKHPGICRARDYRLRGLEVQRVWLWSPAGGSHGGRRGSRRTLRGRPGQRHRAQASRPQGTHTGLPRPIATPQAVSDAETYDFLPTLIDLQFARIYSRYATRNLRVAVKVDVGQERWAFPAEAAADAIETISRMPGLTVHIVNAHPNVPAPPSLDYLDWQLGRFGAMCRQLEAKGISVPIRMVASSKILSLTRKAVLNAVDPGQMFFGPFLAEGDVPWPTRRQALQEIDAAVSFTSVSSTVAILSSRRRFL